MNENVDKLKQFELENLDSVYEHIYHEHNTEEPIIYSSTEALEYFIQKEQELVAAQNKIFSGDSSGDMPQNISKAAKLVLHLSVSLHVFTEQMMRSLCHPCDFARETATYIGITTLKRAFILGDWFLVNRNILER